MTNDLLISIDDLLRKIVKTLDEGRGNEVKDYCASPEKKLAFCLNEKEIANEDRKIRIDIIAYVGGNTV